MAISGLGSIKFDNVFELKKSAAQKSLEAAETKEAESAEETTATQQTKKSQSVKGYMAELGAKYGVNISVYSGSEKSFMNTILSSSGSNNLAISRNIAEQMMKDPELASVVEERIAKLPQEGKEMEEAMHNLGSEMIACGMQIDRNGRISYWGVGYKKRTAADDRKDATEKAQKQKEQERLLAKREERKKQAEKLEEKRAERRAEEKERMEILLAKGDSARELVSNVAVGKFEVIEGEDTANNIRGKLINLTI